MPVYLFTFHAYRSWMPDRPRGYVRRGQGILPPDRQMAQQYEMNAKYDELELDSAIQAVLVDAIRQLCQQKHWRLHQVVTATMHVHFLLSWQGFLCWKGVRRSLRYRCTSALNAAFGTDHPWFSKNGSRKRVRDRGHFDYLMHEYLPGHDGLSWREDREQTRR